MQSAKDIVKNYGYVFVPIHLTVTGTTAILFNYLITHGVDFISILESFHAGDGVITSLRNPKIGKITIVLILVKLVSPLRWLVSLTATVTLVKFFKKRCKK